MSSNRFFIIVLCILTIITCALLGSVIAGVRYIEHVNRENRYLRDQIRDIEDELGDLERELDKLRSDFEDLEEELLELDSLLYGVEVRKMEATAYAPHDDAAVAGMCYQGNPNITATGDQVGDGIFAVDPTEIPYGSKMVVIGSDWIETGKALDTGSAMRSNENLIDMYKPTRQQAFNFGRQDVLVLYREPSK